MPSSEPSGQPFSRPTCIPTTDGYIKPTYLQPSAQPTSVPTQIPSDQPTDQPTGQPSDSPSNQPTCNPSSQPSSEPTSQPTSKPSGQPSSLPSGEPTGLPTTQPTEDPSGQPSDQPSGEPTGQPSNQPSNQPTSKPSGQPSSLPSGEPTGLPTTQPTEDPSGQPSDQPSGEPTGQPSNQPSEQPTRDPSSSPSGQPTGEPSEQPLGQPTGEPSGQPSVLPTAQPTASRNPTGIPSIIPSGEPSTQPSEMPSSQPSCEPSSQPSHEPSGEPSVQPSADPSEKPTNEPSSLPTNQPSEEPSGQPSNQPSDQPTGQPNPEPTSQPTGIPSINPTELPSSLPTLAPSAVRYHDYAPDIISLNVSHQTSDAVWIDVQLSSLATVYCGIFLATAPVTDVSALTIRHQNYVYHTTSQAATIRVNDLKPSLPYVAYCMTLSVNGAPMALANILKRNESFTLIGSRAINVNLLSKYVSSSSSILQPVMTVAFVTPPTPDFEQLVNITLLFQPASFNQSVTATTTIPSMETCLATLNYYPHQIIYSIANSFLQQDIFFAAANDCPGSYLFNFSGAESAVSNNARLYKPLRLELSTSNGLLLEVLPSKGVSNVTTIHMPAPIALSAAYVDRGEAIEVRFDSLTNQAGLGGGWFRCSSLVVVKTSVTAMCYWVDTTVLRIDVGTIESHVEVAIGESLIVVGEKIAALENPVMVQETVLVLTSKVALRPQLVIQAPTVSNACQSFVLDISSSKGAGSRAWKNVSIQVTSVRVDVSSSSDNELNSTTLEMNIAAINAFYQTQYYINAPMALSAEYLTPQYMYLFDITLCNVFEQCTTDYHKLVVVNTTFPRIAFATGTAVATSQAARVLALSGHVLFDDACSGIHNYWELFTTYAAWYLLEVKTAYNQTGFESGYVVYAQGGVVRTAEDLRIIVPAFTLQPETVYEAVLTLYDGQTNQTNQTNQTVFNRVNDTSGLLSSSTSVVVKVLAAPLQAILSTANFLSLGVNQTLVIDGSASFDPDAMSGSTTSSDLTYTWTCLQLTHFSSTPLTSRSTSKNMTAALDCRQSFMLVNGSTSTEVLLSSRQSGVESRYRITLRVSCVSRTGTVRFAETAVEVRVIDAQTSPHLVTIHSPPRDYNYQTQIILFASVSSNAAGIARWSVKHANAVNLSTLAETPVSYDIDPIASNIPFTTINTNLIIPHQTLAPGLTYTFELTFTPTSQEHTASTQSTASAFIVIQTNAIPRDGVFTVTPSRGVELWDVFQLHARAWQSEQLPLKYEFGFFAVDAQVIVLQTQREESMLETLLPRGQTQSLGVTSFALSLPVSSFDRLNGTNTSVSSSNSNSSSSGVTDDRLNTSSSFLSVPPDVSTLVCVVSVRDIFGAAARDTTDVQVLSQPQNLTLVAREYEQRLTQAATSSQRQQVIASTAQIQLVISVNCSSALPPYCQSLNRRNCSTTSHTCGRCLTDGDYIGEAGHANTYCYPQSALAMVPVMRQQRKRLVVRSAVNTEGAGITASMSCSSDDGDVLVCGPLHTCQQGICTAVSKTCLPECVQHGQCVLQHRITLAPLTTCFANDEQCVATCVCETNWYGPSCFVSEAEMVVASSLVTDLSCTYDAALWNQMGEVSSGKEDAIDGVEVESWLAVVSLLAKEPYKLTLVSAECLLHILSRVLLVTATSVDDKSLAFSELQGLFEVTEVLLGWQEFADSAVTTVTQRQAYVDKLTDFTQQSCVLITAKMLPMQYAYEVTQSAFRMNFLPPATQGYSHLTSTFERTALEVYLNTELPTLSLSSRHYQGGGFCGISVPVYPDQSLPTAMTEGTVYNDQLSFLYPGRENDNITLLRKGEVLEEPAGEETFSVSIRYDYDLYHSYDEHVSEPITQELTCVSDNTPITTNKTAQLACPGGHMVQKMCNGTSGVWTLSCPPIIPTLACLIVQPNDNAVVTATNVSTACVLYAITEQLVTFVCPVSVLDHPFHENSSVTSRTAASLPTLLHIHFRTSIEFLSGEESVSFTADDVSYIDFRNSSWQVMITLSFIVFLYLIGIVFADNCDLRDKEEREKQTILLEKRDKAPNRSVHPELLELEMLFPSILNDDQSTFTLFVNECKLAHPWYSLVSHYSLNVSRSLRLLGLMSSVCCTLAMVVYLYSALESEGKAVCATLITVETCQDVSLFGISSFPSLCTWQTNQEECLVIDLTQELLTVQILIAVLAALYSTPLVALCESIIYDIQSKKAGVDNSSLSAVAPRPAKRVLHSHSQSGVIDKPAEPASLSCASQSVHIYICVYLSTAVYLLTVIYLSIICVL